MDCQEPLYEKKKEEYELQLQYNTLDNAKSEVIRIEKTSLVSTVLEKQS
jgi:hypothetical protein